MYPYVHQMSPQQIEELQAAHEERLAEVARASDVRMQSTLQDLEVSVCLVVVHACACVMRALSIPEQAEHQQTLLAISDEVVCVPVSSQR